MTAPQVLQGHKGHKAYQELPLPLVAQAPKAQLVQPVQLEQLASAHEDLLVFKVNQAELVLLVEVLQVLQVHPELKVLPV
jgi:hypothetical protein